MGKPGRGDQADNSDQLRPLHGGRHSIDPEVLAHHQRERLLAALAATVAKHGYNATTISQITAAASVSRRTFYEHFADKEQCFSAAYEALDDYIAGLMAKAEEDEAQWPDRVAASFAALLDFLAVRPNFARLYLVEAYVVGEAMADQRQRTTARLIDLLAPGREFAERDPIEGIEEALVGGILTLLARRIVAEQEPRPEALIPAVVEFALAPYIGVEDARALAARHA